MRKNIIVINNPIKPIDVKNIPPGNFNNKKIPPVNTTKIDKQKKIKFKIFSTFFILKLYFLKNYSIPS